MLFSFVDTREFIATIWNSEISNDKGRLKPGIYGKSCSAGHFQMWYTLPSLLGLNLQFK